MKADNLLWARLIVLIGLIALLLTLLDGLGVI